MAVTEPPHPPQHRGRRRWAAFAAVAVVAAIGGAVVARRWPRRTPPAPVPALVTVSDPPSPPAPPPASARPAGPTPAAARRRALIAVATVAMAAAITGVVGNSIPTGPPVYEITNDAIAHLDTLTPRPITPGWMITPSPPGPLPTRTSPGWPEPTSAWTPPPAPVPAGGVVPYDGTVVLHSDSGEEVQLAIADYQNPAVLPVNPALRPAAGHRLVEVAVRVQTTGRIPFVPDLEKQAWVLDRAGHRYPADLAKTTFHSGEPSGVPQFSVTTRSIIFEVPAGAGLNRFRLTRHPGKPSQTQVWRLP